MLNLYCIQYFKDTKRKQFTTELGYNMEGDTLHSIFQRYKTKAIHNIGAAVYYVKFTAFNISKIQNESNSQRYSLKYVAPLDCIQYFKDTKRKQFTTAVSLSIASSLLHSIFQRYKTKAIHNELTGCIQYACTAFNISKIQNESNSQPKQRSYKAVTYCIQYFKDTKRKQFTTSSEVVDFSVILHSIFQRYKTKAIHNGSLLVCHQVQTAFNISKIQNESNSQRLYLLPLLCQNCIQYFKDTKRKQFTTFWWRSISSRWLHSIFQRYKTKAIHNCCCIFFRCYITAFNISKIQNESNSQHFIATVL